MKADGPGRSYAYCQKKLNSKSNRRRQACTAMMLIRPLALYYVYTLYCLSAIRSPLTSYLD